MVYGFEELRKKFSEHAIQQVELHKRMKQNYEEEYPDEELPDMLKDDFCLPMAFVSIIEEIDRLNIDNMINKRRLDTLTDHIYKDE